MKIKVLDNRKSLVDQRESWILETREFHCLRMINMYLEGIPSILAMVLNAEGRNFSTMINSRSWKEVSDSEKAFFKKWKEILKEKYARRYKEPDVLESVSSMTAAYGFNVFAPSVSMIYSVNAMQLDNILNKIRVYVEFVESKEETERNEFEEKLSNILKDFYNQTSNFVIKESDYKDHNLNLFAPRMRAGGYGEAFSASYSASLAYVLTAQLKTVTSYEIIMPKDGAKIDYYVPVVLNEPKLRIEWKDDLKQLKTPMARLVEVHERGTIEAFKRKTDIASKLINPEFLFCTEDILKKYIDATKMNKRYISNILKIQERMLKTATI